MSHLDHILYSDLSDTDDILRIFKVIYICHRANCLLSTFSATNPAVKTLLFRTFCLPLYGASLWSLASPGLCSLEVTFNNIIIEKILETSSHLSVILISFTVLGVRPQSLHNVVCYTTLKDAVS